MIYVTAYTSHSLSTKSEDRYKEAGITFIDIANEDTDISYQLNKPLFVAQSYPLWSDLPVCLRSDWRRLQGWKLDGDEVVQGRIRDRIKLRFNRPTIIWELTDMIEAYISHLHRDVPHLGGVSNSMDHLYCFDKIEAANLLWPFFLVDMGADPLGKRKLVDALIIGKIQGIVDSVRYNYPC